MPSLASSRFYTECSIRDKDNKLSDLKDRIAGLRLSTKCLRNTSKKLTEPKDQIFIYWALDTACSLRNKVTIYIKLQTVSAQTAKEQFVVNFDKTMKDKGEIFGVFFEEVSYFN